MRTHRWLTFILVSTALSGGGAGCTTGSDGDTGGAGGSGASAGSGGSSGLGAQCDALPVLAVGGVWAASIRMTVSLVAKAGGIITICPEDQQAEASMLMVFEFQQNASDPTRLDSIASHVCGISLPEVTAMTGACDPAAPNLIKTQLIIPDALTNLLPKIELEPVTGTLSGTAPGSVLTPERVVFVMGSTKRDPDLPRWKNDVVDCGYPELGHTNSCDAQCVTDCASLTDDDGDGYPGVTLAVCGRSPDDDKQNIPCNIDDPSKAGVIVQGRAWLDMQIDPLMTGVAKSSCELVGTVDANIRYNLVGSDCYLSNAQIGVSTSITALPIFSVVADDSPYRMLRVDGQHGSPDWKLDFADGPGACGVLLDRQAELL